MGHEPKELVKRCQHMPEEHGYAEALRLLNEKYMNVWGNGQSDK